MENEIMTMAIKLVIMVVVCLVYKYALPYLKAHGYIEQLATILAYAKSFVAAAEMLFPESGSGDSKREYATNMLDAKLKELGINATTDEIRSYVEDAVKTMNEESVVTEEA